MQAVPSNKHLIRLSSQFHIQSFKAYILNLGLKEKDYENISQQYETNGPESVMFMALIKWRDTQLYHCTLQQLHDALLEVAIDCHRICQVTYFKSGVQIFLPHVCRIYKNFNIFKQDSFNDSRFIKGSFEINQVKVE